MFVSFLYQPYEAELKWAVHSAAMGIEWYKLNCYTILEYGNDYVQEKSCWYWSFKVEIEIEVEVEVEVEA